MRVLVTGAGGTLGREVVARLAADGRSVRAHDRAAMPEEVTDQADEVVVGDLRDSGHLAEALSGVDAVVHAAALPSPKSATEQEVFTNNVESAYHVLDAAGRAGIGRIVYISSLSAIGLAWARREVSPERVPVTETHPYVGDDVYGLSKYVGELIAVTVSRRWATTMVSLRFPFLGTGERLQHHLARVHADPAVERNALWGWLDTRDAARAVAAALTRPLAGHVVINVAAPDTTALVPTTELLHRYHPTTRIDAPLDGFDVPFSTRLSHELLDFTPIHAWRTTKDDTP
ncbi:MAG TPA: NAD(P)-dependent oxidoreductase [Streptosporangiaceae bacterium]|nr:NAD(P)-dependent oxidoreductase [Streptosporangiaceae bacterium]